MDGVPSSGGSVP